MGCDIVVALGRATVDGRTLFGQNGNLEAGQRLANKGRSAPGHAYAVGEFSTPFVALPQARQTYTVLGARPEEGSGDIQFGLNEHRLAAGCTEVRSKLSDPKQGLAGTDLVRLVLERSRNAQQGVDVLTELISATDRAVPRGKATTPCCWRTGRRRLRSRPPAGTGSASPSGPCATVGGVYSVRQDWNRISPQAWRAWPSSEAGGLRTAANSISRAYSVRPPTNRSRARSAASVRPRSWSSRPAISTRPSCAGSSAITRKAAVSM